MLKTTFPRNDTREEVVTKFYCIANSVDIKGESNLVFPMLDLDQNDRFLLSPSQAFLRHFWIEAETTSEVKDSSEG